MMAGASKGSDARYEIVCTRLTNSELRVLQGFANARKIGITAAVRMLIMTGIELLEGGE